MGSAMRRRGCGSRGRARCPRVRRGARALRGVGTHARPPWRSMRRVGARLERGASGGGGDGVAGMSSGDVKSADEVRGRPVRALVRGKGDCKRYSNIFF
jgi:hypothetical protein